MVRMSSVASRRQTRAGIEIAHDSPSRLVVKVVVGTTAFHLRQPRAPTVVPASGHDDGRRKDRQFVGLEGSRLPTRIVSIAVLPVRLLRHASTKKFSCGRLAF